MTSTSIQNIVFRAATPDDCDGLLDVMRQFLDTAPVMFSLGGKGHCMPAAVLHEWVHSMLEDAGDLTAVAWDEEAGKAAGALFCCGYTQGDDCVSPAENYLKYLGAEEMAKGLFELVDTMEKEANVFDKYSVDNYVKLANLSVLKPYQKRGIARSLTEKAIELARNQGFQAVSILTTSAYAYSITKSMGFDDLSQASFKAVENWEKIFPTEILEIHSDISISAKKI